MKTGEYFSIKFGRYSFSPFLNLATSLSCQFINFFEGGRVSLTRFESVLGSLCGPEVVKQPCLTRLLGHALIELCFIIVWGRGKTGHFRPLGRGHGPKCPLPGSASVRRDHWSCSWVPQTSGYALRCMYRTRMETSYAIVY